ncbi:ankyrin repeat domain containing protein [Pyrenophora tritici-repentis]|nr:ankyrin repeat domain containing protein [Pyrenophora tritici-repentis]KAI2488316.1 ankyrin repeat domain containing protein [Pyrenophora tritici-repentis]
MRATWVAIESSFLAEHPEDRHHVSLSELEFSATVLPAGSFVSNQEQRILPRRRPPLYNKGWRFYVKLQPELFQLLNTGVSTELQGYPGDLLFGMALSRASAKLKEYHSDVKSLINGATAVAHPSIRAEGIVMRINSAIPGGGSEKHAHTPNPNLYEAAASGSITAFSDLRKSDTNKARTAEQVFRCKGGYNRESILAARFEYTAIKQKIISSANSSTSLAPSELCITIGPDEIYDDHSDPRNTLLHLAAAFGVCEAIIHLTEDKHLDLNARNTEDETPLYKASIAGQYEATVLLLNLGADPSICNDTQTIPAESHLKYGDFENDDDLTKAEKATIRQKLATRKRQVTFSCGDGQGNSEDEGNDVNAAERRRQSCRQSLKKAVKPADKTSIELGYDDDTDDMYLRFYSIHDNDKREILADIRNVNDFTACIAEHAESVFGHLADLLS